MAAGNEPDEDLVAQRLPVDLLDARHVDRDRYLAVLLPYRHLLAARVIE